MSLFSDTRQQLYDRIKSSTKDVVILEEMIRLGFWKKNDGAPSVPEQLIRQEAELVQQLRELSEKQRLYENRQAVLREMRKERLAASKLKQKERKQLRLQQREQKAKEWGEKKAHQITYLGEQVSKRLNEIENNLERLSKNGLSPYPSEEALATAMGITVGELRFLSFSREVSAVNHYRKFTIPKKTGGKRTISAPMPRLKKAQHWILESILNKVVLHEAAHGFVRSKSIVTNAKAHVQSQLMINLDLKDFFPSITYPRVKGLFKSLGYSEKLATIFSLLCTEPETEEVQLDGKTYFVSISERKLPQGAPSSPAITNLICRGLDARLKGLAEKYGFVYTRYADDLSFSTQDPSQEKGHALLANIRKVLSDEDFTVHPEKLKILRKGNRKEVTGVVVNDKLAVKAKDLDRFRALLYQIEKTGTLEGKHWNGSRNLLAAMQGYSNFIHMVDPVKGGPLKERVKAILVQHAFKHQIKHPSKAQQEKIRLEELAKEKGKKPWWKFW
jgi:retron-type reverse transcriptase